MHQELANAIRFLSIDAVEAAKSGHPGMPMGMADIAVVLWREFLHHNPNNPQWWNRDRFVLSNGHGSMLLYSLLHLTGYDLSLDDLKAFRQLGSKTPGHPEHGYAPGVETTTGPLGQGLANAVGMALAEKVLAAQFNKKDFSIIDHHTYAFLGDGCLMEGVSHEAASLAGTWGLNKLIAIWDDNGISIDGKVNDWFTDDTPKRFEAYGWHVIRDVDGHNPDMVRQALQTAHFEKKRPVLICCKTKIGFGSPSKMGSESCHGAPLGPEEVEKTREALKWSHAPFVIPQDVYSAFDAKEQGLEREASWKKTFDQYQAAHPDLAKELTRRMSGSLPDLYGLMIERLKYLNEQLPHVATRKASQDALSLFVPCIPELIGGSADLTGSNLTFTPSSEPIVHNSFAGNYLYYGVREFGMSAIANGMALHQGLIPFVSTFLVFTDYARNAIRMAALMKQRVIYVMTHDSIGLGEDGPTHQPVEHLNTLRLIPNLHVWRPADATETLVAWHLALEKKDGPTLLALSRQKLETFPRIEAQLEQIKRGGYVLHYTAEKPQLNLIATGSEVELAMKAAHSLEEQGIMTKVISMPCLEQFMAAEATYQHEVMGDLPSLVIEAGTTGLWYKLIKGHGHVIGIDSFGESGKAEDLLKHFGFTVDHVVEEAKKLIQHAD